MSRPTILFASLLAMLLATFSAAHLLLTPPPLNKAPQAGEFDANRAFARLERILGDQRPHPVDSVASDRVRERLLGELRAAGLNPRITDTITCNSLSPARSLACARVRNIVATIGPAEGKHLLLVSHYDSSTAGPGAADDGIGVASMIEIASLLRQERLARPISFLFNEGEESGLLGARAFLDNDPVAPRVDALINLEARGVTGPALMFETSQPNGAAIAAFARGSHRPFANSLSTDFYRMLPNSTDVAVFEERPWTILNFAITGNETRYHTPGDNLAALDRRSLQHLGSQALSVARGFQESGPAAGQTIYTDFWGALFVSLPLNVGVALIAALLLAFLWLAFRRRALGRPLLTVAAGVIGAGLLAFLLDYFVALIRPADYWRGYPLATFAALYATALAAVAAALLTVGRNADRERLRAGFWLLFMLIGALVCWVANGAAIFFILPPLIAAIGVCIRRFWSPAERAAAVAAGLVLLLSFSELTALIELTLVDGPYWILALLAAIAALPLLIEAKGGSDLARRPLLWGSAVVAAALWALVLVLPRATNERPQGFTIEYVRDAAAGRSLWAISNKRVPLPDAWSTFGDWRLAELPHSGRKRWTIPAPAIASPAPVVELVSQGQSGDARRLRVRLRPNGADAVMLRLPPGAALRAAGVPGALRRMAGAGPPSPYWLRCGGRSCDGMELDLVLGARTPIKGTIIGTHHRLPPGAKPLIDARPADAVPQYGPDATQLVAPVTL